jgi:hypothetical protein
MPRTEASRPDRQMARKTAREAARASDRSRAREGRALRAEAYDGLFAPWALAATGAVVSLAFLFQPNLAIKALLFSLFLGAALASGKKVSLLATLLVSAGIILANLLVPVGLVLWKAGPLLVTKTALLDGIGKALTFEGLIYISKASIRPGLRLPGNFGGIVARAFVYYDRIVEYRGKLRAASLFEDLDALMLSIWDAPAPSPGEAGAEPIRPRSGHALLVAVSLFATSALVAGYLLPR